MPEEQGDAAGAGAGGEARSSVWVREERAGCGIQGCLYGSVALFVILLVAMLILVVMRFGAPL